MRNYLLFSLVILAGCTVPKKPLVQDQEILLKNYRPQSIYTASGKSTRKTNFPIIDMHSHPYTQSEEELDQWVRTMDEKGIEKTIVLTFETGKSFDSLVASYSKYKDRFDLWCGFDYTDYPKAGWIDNAIRELERCHQAGAKGIGELGDKGIGLSYSKPTRALGLHIDDPSLQPLLRRCGELGMPLNIHVAEPYWMYLPADSTNDGLMNGKTWKVDMTQEGIIGHTELVNTLENAVMNNPNTTFIACHFANCSYDLSILGKMLDKYPNLYADISARYAETAPIPRYMKGFYHKYQDKLLYGTDMGTGGSMYDITFRILESQDEHFYEIEQFNYHWPLYGFDLDSTVLQKIYRSNAEKILAL